MSPKAAMKRCVFSLLQRTGSEHSSSSSSLLVVFFQNLINLDLSDEIDPVQWKRMHGSFWSYRAWSSSRLCRAP